MERKGKVKLTFAELGLKTCLPETLTRTNAEKQALRLKNKKDKAERVIQAHSNLENDMKVVQRHKEFVEEESRQSKREKEVRKQNLLAEHVQSRNARNQESEARERNLASHKAVVTTNVRTAMELEQKRLDDVQKVIEETMESEMSSKFPAICINVQRSPKIVECRDSLPVMREEQAIIEAITEAPGGCVLICGETGSGKTTQVPQFLWECGFGHVDGQPAGRNGMIVVTEPRRVAAVAMAQRVAEELNETLGDTVGYQVRYDSTVTRNTKMKFVTEGILLREVQGDFLLRRYSVVIIDEAHERSVSGDLLVGLLSRIVPLRHSLSLEGTILDGEAVTPLKLVIMSATMRVSDFKDNRLLLPREPPLINVEARRFSVTNHFAKKTVLRNYCEEVFSKIKQIHKRLPPGGILVFLCTQREIDSMCDRLRRHYRSTKIVYDANNFRKHSLLRRRATEDPKDAFGVSNDQYDLESTQKPSSVLEDFGLRDDFDYGDGEEESVEATENEHVAPSEVSDNEEGDDKESTEFEVDLEDEADGVLDTLHVLPLYSLLNFDDQQKVFQDPPPGKRLCVVSTNVAETSITIPGIRYVVDCGRVKNKKLDGSSGANSFVIEWTSQASAEQRSGRAGRTSPGHCYRLFSTAVFTNLMPKHSTPEILRTPIESVVLLMKSVGIANVSKFPFPTPPTVGEIEKAARHLILLGALDRQTLNITESGHTLTRFPVAPRFAKMLLTAKNLGQHAVLQLITSAVAVCATTLDVFEHETVQECFRGDSSTHRVSDQKRLLSAGSDLMTFANTLRIFCKRPTVATAARYNMVHKSIAEAKQLYHQLNGILESAVSFDPFEETEESVSEQSNQQGESLTAKDVEIVFRKVVSIGLIDHIARRASVNECRIRGVEFFSGKTTKVPYFDIRSNTILFVHPSSSVASTHPPPEYIAYCGLQRSHREGTSAPKTFMKGVTVLTKDWLNSVEYDEDAVCQISNQVIDV